jgi:hydroxymethylglutaryl-CoA reductase (NADPH)
MKSANSDNNLLDLKSNTLKIYNLEKEIPDFEEAVKIRRKIIENKTKKNVFKNVPFKNYPYKDIFGRCCENVIGFIQVPLGLAGPILVDDKEYYLPMATTEGTLIASTTRGANVITQSGGCQTMIINNGITRAPVITCSSAKEALTIKTFCIENYDKIKEIFNSSSRYAKLEEIKSSIIGRHIYLRFKCTTGDAMGMNMISKGTELALRTILETFPNSKLKSLSGNMCVDKKASAMNFIEGRGKSVICECIIKEEVIENVLKTSVEKLIELNYLKNMIGSSAACTIGGNNAQAANIVTAMFIACGQDVAQNVESSHCITLMELADNKKDLYVSVTMPCLEVGTIGGGTHLPGQAAMLDLLNVKGSQEKNIGENACQLARIISSAVLSGELSLMAALLNNELISAHMKLNRKK